MAYTPTLDRNRLLLDAFQELRAALLYYFIGLILVLLSLAPLVWAGLLPMIGPGASVGLAGITIVLIILGALILLYSFVRLYGAGGRFATADSRLSGLRTGIQLAIVGVILLILGALASLASPTGGFALIILAGLLGLVGQVLIGIFFLRLGDLEKEGLPVPSGFKTVGILYLIGIVIGILQLVALILAYIYAGDAIQRLQAQAGAEGLAAPTVSSY